MLVIRIILFQPIPNHPTALPSTPAENALPGMTITDLDRDWETLSVTLPLTGICKNLVRYCTLIEKSEQRWRLALDPSHAKMITKQHQERIQQAIELVCSPKVPIEFVHSDSPIACPAHCQQARFEYRLKQAQDDIPKNPSITALKNQFNATIDERSIELFDSST